MLSAQCQNLIRKPLESQKIIPFANDTPLWPGRPVLWNGQTTFSAFAYPSVQIAFFRLKSQFLARSSETVCAAKKFIKMNFLLHHSQRLMQSLSRNVIFKNEQNSALKCQNLKIFLIQFYQYTLYRIRLVVLPFWSRITCWTTFLKWKKLIGRRVSEIIQKNSIFRHFGLIYWQF